MRVRQNLATMSLLSVTNFKPSFFFIWMILFILCSLILLKNDANYQDRRTYPEIIMRTEKWKMTCCALYSFKMYIIRYLSKILFPI